MTDLTELGYIALVFGLFVVPRVLQMWRIPRAITALAMGAAAGIGFHAFHDDATIELFATLGISTLFLFAGLEVRSDELWINRRPLLRKIAVQLVLLAAIGYAVHWFTGLKVQPSALVALALLTPSAGFILESLSSYGLEPDHQSWVRSETIASEIVSLLVLFFVLQSSSTMQFLGGTAALALLVLALPVVFGLFARWLAPVAPRSEFAFLVMMTIGAAFITRQLGAYYLVGAFVVGIVAQSFRERLPALGSEELVHAVDVFASFFIPFYFFAAGLHLEADQFSPQALAVGVGLVVVLVPLRVGVVALQTWATLGTHFADSRRMATALIPTLVFTLVTAEILRDVFQVPAWIFGGLVVYALGNTLVPGLLLHTPPTEFDDPDLPEVIFPKPGDNEPEAA